MNHPRTNIPNRSATSNILGTNPRSNRQRGCDTEGAARSTRPRNRSDDARLQGGESHRNQTVQATPNLSGAGQKPCTKTGCYPGSALVQRKETTDVRLSRHHWLGSIGPRPRKTLFPERGLDDERIRAPRATPLIALATGSERTSVPPSELQESLITTMH